MRLENKVAIITGGARGIGYATAKLFASEGANVVIADRLDSVPDLTAPGTHNMFYVKTDISQETECNRLVKATIDKHGRLDVLINNAAVFGVGTLLDATASDFDHVFDVNVKGTGLCCKAAIPELRKSGKGAIVNVSSMNGVIGTPGQCIYNASKAAIIALTKSIAIDFPDIRANVILPGMTRTEALDEVLDDLGIDREEGYRSASKTPILKRLAAPEEIAQGILFLASDEASYATACSLSMDGGVVGARAVAE